MMFEPSGSRLLCIGLSTRRKMVKGRGWTSPLASKRTSPISPSSMSGGEQRPGHRRAAAVGARDRVQQHLGRLRGVDGVRGHDAARLGRPELAHEPPSRRAEPLQRDARRRTRGCPRAPRPSASKTVRAARPRRRGRGPAVGAEPARDLARHEAGRRPAPAEDGRRRRAARPAARGDPRASARRARGRPGRSAVARPTTSSPSSARGPRRCAGRPPGRSRVVAVHDRQAADPPVVRELRQGGALRVVGARRARA